MPSVEKARAPRDARRHGLHREPFQATLDEAFYFSEPVREKRLNLLLHLTPYSAVLLVTGEAGSGVSTLLQRFLRRASGSWRICRIQATAQTGVAQLLDTLDNEFSFGTEAAADPGRRLERVREGLRALRRSALVPVLIIDDAHLLPIEAFRLLEALTEPWDETPALCLILAGENALNERLADPALAGLRTRVSHAFDLPPLSEAQTAGYIRHRLGAAGMESSGESGGPFTPSVIKFIHVASRGLPGRINEFAQVVLKNNAPPARDGRTGTAPRAGLPYRYLVAAFVVALSVAGLLYQDRIADLSRDLFQDRSRPLVAGDGPPAPGPHETRPGPPSRAVGVPSGSGTGLAQPPPPPADIPETETAVPSSAPPETDVVTDVEAGGPAAAEGEGVASAAQDGGGSVTEAPAPPPDEPPGPPPSIAGEAHVPLPASTPAVVTAGEPPAGASSMPPVAAAPALRDEGWLLERDPAHYTLQLLAMAPPKSLAFIERNGLTGEAAVHRIRRQGGELLAVTYGDYATREEAARAAAALAARLGGGIKPWIRPFSAVQAAVVVQGTKRTRTED